jgi:probable HAF family extracellular repeat protein
MPGASAATGGTAAFGISGNGNVIVGAGGVSSSQQEAFRWTAAGGYHVLGDLGGGNSDARAASFDGSVVVGQSLDANQVNRAYRWTAAHGMVALPFNSFQSFSNEADTVTDDGKMVAGAQAWWKTNGQMGNFGTSSSSQVSIEMFDLSANGSVAAGFGPGGKDMFGQQASNAFRWTPAGGAKDIDRVFNRNSDASGISADGSTIVGEAQDSQGHYRAFRWTAATGMVDLGTLGSGNLVSNATATSKDGSVVVGTSLTTTSSGSDHAFVWTATTGMQDLNTLLHGIIPKGWILQVATDVSEDGTVITGYGISPPPPGSRFGTMEPWRIVLSSPTSAPGRASMTNTGAQTSAMQDLHVGLSPRINPALLSATPAVVAHDGLIQMNSSTGPGAPATMPAAPNWMRPPTLDAALVDQVFAAADQRDQPLSLGGHSSRMHEVAATGDQDVLAGDTWLLDRV